MQNILFQEIFQEIQNLRYNKANGGLITRVGPFKAGKDVKKSPLIKGGKEDPANTLYPNCYEGIVISDEFAGHARSSTLVPGAVGNTIILVCIDPILVRIAGQGGMDLVTCETFISPTKIADSQHRIERTYKEVSFTHGVLVRYNYQVLIGTFTKMESEDKILKADTGAKAGSVVTSISKL
jgi:hypothetical protein